MRILIVSNTYPPADISGVGSLVHEMAHRLGQEPENFVRVLTRKAPSDDPYAVSVGFAWLGKAGFVLLCGLQYFVRAWRERYELIHVHESDGASVVFLWWLMRLLRLSPGRAKLVATLQVSYDEELRQVKPVKADGVIVSEPTREELAFRNRAKVQAKLGRFIVRHADAIVAPSKVTKGELEEDYKARDVKVIHNGIRITDSLAGAALEREAARQASGRPPTVLYVGRVRTRKAVAVLLVAFRRVLEEIEDAHLVVVGEGEQLKALRRRCRELSLHDHVRLVGKVSRSMLGTYYRDADIYCLPSLYEGFPLAILEAMAAALPVVATRVSGNPEAVDDGVTGLLVKPEKAGELADKLLELLRDPERAREMGRRGREKLEERFTIDRIAEKYLRLWHNLLDPASGEATSEPADSDPAASEPAASARSDPSNHPP